MTTKSKYAYQLIPKLEEAARAIYSIHQSGAKNRGDKIEQVLQALPNGKRDEVMLRAQRLSLDGLPLESTKKPVEPPPPPPDKPPVTKEKPRATKPASKAKVSKKASNNGKKPNNNKLPF
jgi:hypothetical protein